MWSVLLAGYRLLFYKTLNSQKIAKQHACSRWVFQPLTFCIRRFKYVSQVQICVTTVLIIYGGKKASETVMQLYMCIMQKRIQLSWCHTRQAYYRIPAKDTQNNCTASRILLAASVCDPASCQFIITNFREKKQAYFELQGYSDQRFI